MSILLSEEMLSRIRSRRDGHREWLRENFPLIFQEQAHLEKGTVERYYWHYGYMMALDDLIERVFIKL